VEPRGSAYATISAACDRPPANAGSGRRGL